MSATDRWERRLGVRQDLRGVYLQWDVDPSLGVPVSLTGREATLRELSVSGAAIMGPYGAEYVPGADVMLSHGEASGKVRIRRVELIGDASLRLYAVELTDPNPALANALYPYLDSPATGELLSSWHGRYVD